MNMDPTHITIDPNHPHRAAAEFFGTAVYITAVNANHVTFVIPENKPATINKIRVEGRAYFKLRDHGPANSWFGEGPFLHRIPQAGETRWSTSDPTDNQRSKAYRRFVEICELLPASMFHAAQVVDLERQVEAKEQEIEKAKSDLLKLQEQHRSLQIEHETAALA